MAALKKIMTIEGEGIASIEEFDESNNNQLLIVRTEMQRTFVYNKNTNKQIFNLTTNGNTNRINIKDGYNALSHLNYFTNGNVLTMFIYKYDKYNLKYEL